jgi:hypothetical protein
MEVGKGATRTGVRPAADGVDDATTGGAKPYGGTAMNNEGAVLVSTWAAT